MIKLNGVSLFKEFLQMGHWQWFETKSNLSMAECTNVLIDNLIEILMFCVHTIFF